ncbi:hypothetical protein B7O87_10995 [Cylindrospermopsis raciborskii CENA303]|uniref:Lysozyme inhibitor LprI-like N-terminal domain-containing protein n=1 Tax=Cylindrospermopsis raciborskii CENA303 TaxID=1170769 RepID=A0A1X4G548_9CYAN|nr:lysozyme inhibitor LprI family protein [Cylindrospermopsis raciborskii]OSO89680.1 hypothetical protein B7O87_10995 [Cylindrospermopsis raciborskii CENA303]
MRSPLTFSTESYNLISSRRQAKLLVAAEEAWIKYRDASCAFSRLVSRIIHEGRLLFLNYPKGLTSLK